MNEFLSKSQFLRGWQCPLSLYLLKYNPELRSLPGPSIQNAFKQGHIVGKLAWDLFPGGLDLSEEHPADYERWLDSTRKALTSDYKYYYEPAFRYNGMFCAVDILERDGKSWNVYEVKSSTSVSEVNIEDASVQYYILKNTGLSLNNVSIIHINNEYIRKETLNVHKLFQIQNIKEKVEKTQTEIINTIDKLRHMLNENTAPEIGIGPHCFNPYECDFKNHCWRNVGSPSVFEIARLSYKEKFALYERGEVSFQELSNETVENLDQIQQIQVKSTLRNEDYIHSDRINEFISTVKHPIHFLDFESMMTAVPEIYGTRPYQQIPFQYSLHILSDKNSEIQHFEFLAEENQPDPRTVFLQNLQKHILDEGSILAYNSSYEKMVLRQLAQAFPEFENFIALLLPRFVDLALPFKNKYIYKPAMKGSYSIKYVLPALFPDLKYSDLEISDGQSAMNAYLEIRNNPDTENNLNIRKDLLEYCRLDTFAMVKIWEYMNKFYEIQHENSFPL